MKALIRAAISKADDIADGLIECFRTALGHDDDATIVSYLGHAGAGRAYLIGRVLRRPPLIRSAPTDTRWRNFRHVYMSFATREVPYARVRARFAGSTIEAVADKEGYFQAEIRPGSLPEAPMLQEVALELVQPVPQEPRNKIAAGTVLVPPASARYGVISDIDDTVVSTNVTSKLRMALTVLFSNAYSRVPFGGLPAFYRALRDGVGGSDFNPIFYVSNGPWNLYPLLMEFLRLNDIPIGPVYLRDFGDQLLFSPDPPGAHKLAWIERLLASYPGLPFILIGDSGERDPEIYREIVRRHPDRIRVIYIRAVDRSPARVTAIESLIREVSQTRTQFVVVPDSEFAAVHAASEGLIAPEALKTICTNKRAA